MLARTSGPTTYTSGTTPPRFSMMTVAPDIWLEKKMEKMERKAQCYVGKLLVCAIKGNELCLYDIERSSSVNIPATEPIMLVKVRWATKRDILVFANRVADIKEDTPKEDVLVLDFLYKETIVSFPVRPHWWKRCILTVGLKEAGKE